MFEERLQRKTGFRLPNNCAIDHSKAVLLLQCLNRSVFDGLAFYRVNLFYWYKIFTLGCCKNTKRDLSNLNSSNTDGLFTMSNSNSFLSPYEILLIARENKMFRVFFLFYHDII